ncbi:MAG: hypothetical protein AMXMBFR33_17560 [Candidatus Xenobia bacterium]
MLNDGREESGQTTQDGAPVQTEEPVASVEEAEPAPGATPTRLQFLRGLKSSKTKAAERVQALNQVPLEQLQKKEEEALAAALNVLAREEMKAPLAFSSLLPGLQERTLLLVAEEKTEGFESLLAYCVEHKLPCSDLAVALLRAAGTPDSLEWEAYLHRQQADGASPEEISVRVLKILGEARGELNTLTRVDFLLCLTPSDLQLFLRGGSLRPDSDELRSIRRCLEDRLRSPEGSRGLRSQFPCAWRAPRLLELAARFESRYPREFEGLRELFLDQVLSRPSTPKPPEPAAEPEDGKKKKKSRPKSAAPEAGAFGTPSSRLRFLPLFSNEFQKVALTRLFEKSVPPAGRDKWSDVAGTLFQAVELTREAPQGPELLLVLGRAWSERLQLWHLQARKLAGLLFGDKVAHELKQPIVRLLGDEVSRATSSSSSDAIADAHRIIRNVLAWIVEHAGAASVVSLFEELPAAQWSALADRLPPEQTDAILAQLLDFLEKELAAHRAPHRVQQLQVLASAFREDSSESLRAHVVRILQHVIGARLENEDPGLTDFLRPFLEIDYCLQELAGWIPSQGGFRLQPGGLQLAVLKQLLGSVNRAHRAALAHAYMEIPDLDREALIEVLSDPQLLEAEQVARLENPLAGDALKRRLEAAATTLEGRAELASRRVSEHKSQLAVEALELLAGLSESWHGLEDLQTLTGQVRNRVERFLEDPIHFDSLQEIDRLRAQLAQGQSGISIDDEISQFWGKWTGGASRESADDEKWLEFFEGAFLELSDTSLKESGRLEIMKCLQAALRARADLTGTIEQEFGQMLNLLPDVRKLLQDPEASPQAASEDWVGKVSRFERLCADIDQEEERLKKRCLSDLAESLGPALDNLEQVLLGYFRFRTQLGARLRLEPVASHPGQRVPRSELDRGFALPRSAESLDALWARTMGLRVVGEARAVWQANCEGQS